MVVRLDQDEVEPGEDEIVVVARVARQRQALLVAGQVLVAMAHVVVGPADEKAAAELGVVEMRRAVGAAAIDAVQVERARRRADVVRGLPLLLRERSAVERQLVVDELGQEGEAGRLGRGGGGLAAGIHRPTGGTQRHELGGARLVRRQIREGATVAAIGTGTSASSPRRTARPSGASPCPFIRAPERRLCGAARLPSSHEVPMPPNSRERPRFAVINSTPGRLRLGRAAATRPRICRPRRGARSGGRSRAMDEPIWQPSAERAASTQISRSSPPVTAFPAPRPWRAVALVGRPSRPLLGRARPDHGGAAGPAAGGRARRRRPHAGCSLAGRGGAELRGEPAATP